jgi:predicted regulator of Ras-like GTPase activity (Roadblock/LC7/MglB family)
MASIRDLVAALRQREGVDAAILLGRDGLPIDSQVVDGVDPDALSARIPSVVQAAQELGAAAKRGDLVTMVLEHRDGIAILSILTSDAILLVLVRVSANVGQLLYELRRNREHIAALV